MDNRKVMLREFKRIQDMHKKFKITGEGKSYDEYAHRFCVAAMHEELKEFVDAKDPVNQLDAVADLYIFALGTADRVGIGYDFIKFVCNRLKDKSFKLPYQPVDFIVEVIEQDIEEYDTCGYTFDPIFRFRDVISLVTSILSLAYRMGYYRLCETDTTVFHEAFNLIMDSNMKKELGSNRKRGGYGLDLVKPEGWKPADLDDLI